MVTVSTLTRSLGALALAFVCLFWPAADCLANDAGLLRRIEEERAAILERNRSSVVRIHAIYATSGGDEGLQLGRGFTHGTGFIIDGSGHVLTVEEAVRGADEIRVTLDSGVQVPATYVGSDEASEVALIHIQAEGLVPAELGDSDGLRVGHFAFILGNSFGNLRPSFGFAQEIDRTQDLIHIAAPVHPGYGGAPVFSSTGEVVGMVWAAVDPLSAFRTSEREGAVGPVAWQEAQTTVYVVPINRAVRIAGRLAKQRQPVYGYLGIQGELYPDGGVRVVDIAADGPAASSDISAGDLIVSYQGASVQNLWHFIYMVLTTAPGTSASLDLLRNGQRVAAAVTVGQMAPDVFNEIVAKMTPNPSGQDGGSVMPVGRGLAKPASLGPGQPGAFGFSQDPRAVFREIDKLEREILRLRQQLMNGGR